MAAKQSTRQRAHRKQYLAAKRALQPALLAVREHSVAKSKRGGAGTAAKCSACGQPKMRTHKQLGLHRFYSLTCGTRWSTMVACYTSRGHACLPDCVVKWTMNVAHLRLMNEQASAYVALRQCKVRRVTHQQPPPAAVRPAAATTAAAAS